MDTETTQYLMGLGASVHKIKLSALRMREALEVPDGSGDLDNFSELSKNEERIKEILYRLSDHLNNVDAALYPIESIYLEL